MPTWASTPTPRSPRSREVPISLHCWQGDDVGGFENVGEALGGGLAVTGNYPGRARTPDELRADATKALSLIPGTHRFNLHAFYGEFGGKRVDRDEIEPEHFAGWIDWAKALGIGLDFNPTFFSHPKAADGFTLAHPDPAIRAFWIHHGIACRRIGAAMGEALGTPCVTNLWIPDGMKDTPVDRLGPRERLVASLDEIFAEPIDRGAQPRRGRGQAVRPRASRATSSARTSSTSATRCRAGCSASTPATTTRPRRSPTRSARSCCSCRRSCCTSAAACAGTATTSSS